MRKIENTPLKIQWGHHEADAPVVTYVIDAAYVIGLSVC